MASHNELGRIGEALAKTFFEDQGYEVLHVNWKYSYYEIDLIASRNEVLHFIEVKTRRGKLFGFPEESVNATKLEKIMHAAEEFMYRYPVWTKVQYDVLSISFEDGKDPEYFLIEDVYL